MGNARGEEEDSKSSHTLAVHASRTVHAIAQRVVMRRIGEGARRAVDGHARAQWAVLAHRADVLVGRAACVVAIVTLGTVACVGQESVLLSALEIQSTLFIQ